MIRLDDIDENGNPVTPEKLKELRQDLKGAPMLSKAGAKTVDDDVTFYKGLTVAKDQFGNEI